MNYDFTNGFSVVIMFLNTTCFKISLRLLETFLFDVEHCCVPESNLPFGSLLYRILFMLCVGFLKKLVLNSVW